MRRVFDRIIVIKFLIAFITCIGICGIAELLFYSMPWLCDAVDYWNMGGTLKDSGFKLNVLDGFRGYIYPLYLGVVNFLGGKTCWYITNAIIVSIFSVIICPKLAEEDIFKKANILKTIAFNLILTILFVGLIAYPLSDLFAMILFCTSVFFSKLSLESEKSFIKLITAFFSGFFAYLAYNTRTIYLFAGIVLALIYIYKSGILSRFLKCLICVISGTFGVGVAAIPQIIMNYANIGKISMAVPTNNLMLRQMFWGLMWQRYDTYTPLTIDQAHPYPQVYFMDDAGVRIISEMQISNFETWGDYFTVLIKYPIDVACIYVRHLVNFILPCWPEVYVTNLNSSKCFLGIIGFSIFFLVALVLIKKCYRSIKNIKYFFPIITPGILIIPGAVEHRFSLPLYIFALAILCFNTDWKKVKEYFWSHKISVISVYLITAMLCFGIWSNMLSSESVTPLLF